MKEERATSQPIRFVGKRQQGGGYGKPPGQSDEFLTLVEPGTPCGEFMRRYWHPVGVSSKVTTDPKRVRILGENLILFRDGQGKPGLLPRELRTPRHLSTTARSRTRAFAAATTAGCLRSMALVSNSPASRGGQHRDKCRQPWYPVEERYGLVFAYMGPLDSMPSLPTYDVLEGLGPDEELQQEDQSFYIGGGVSQENPVAPYSWLQNFENVMDPFHVVILHSRFSGVQFRDQMAAMPTVEWELCDHGVMYRSVRQTGGAQFTRITQTLLPNVRIVPSIELAPGQGRRSPGWCRWTAITIAASAWHVSRRTRSRSIRDALAWRFSRARRGRK